MRTNTIKAGARLALIVLAASAILSSCTTAPKPVEDQSQNIVWPAPPDQSRIAYVRSIHEPADVGLHRSAFGRFFRNVFGAGADERLIKPLGIGLDENDNLCITDTGANCVAYFDRIKKQWRRWDRIGKQRFVAPVAVAKRYDVFYVADSGLGRVVAFRPDGKLLFEIRDRLERPTGLTIAGEQLFVTDAQRHCVVIFDLDGKYQSEFGKRGTDPGQFNYPTHISADRAGHLFVSDSMNNRIQVFDTAGTFQTQLGGAGDAPGNFSRPKGVAADALEHIYVVDANFDNFQIFDMQGHILLNVGEAGAGPGQFWLPGGIAISTDNEIYIADCYNHRVQVFKYVGPS